MHHIKRYGKRWLLILLPLLAITFSLGTGSYQIDPVSVFKILFAKITGGSSGLDPLTVNVLLKTRLPRILTAATVSVALTVSGAVFQGLFKNPLASPYTLGVSNGAGFGAALGILLSLSAVGVQFTAVLFGIAAVGLTLLLSIRSGRTTVTLLLSGMLVSALFASLLSLMKFVADPFEKLPQIIYWLLGTFNGANMTKLLYILPGYLVTLTIIFLYRWRINVLSMGDVEAASYGIDVRRDRTVILTAAGVLTALAVSVAGIIGWVGIVIPHFARMLVGPDFRKIMPVCISLGMTYLVLIDDICRSATGQEIPLGVVTGIVGAPLFIYFIYKRKVRWA
ncbi:MAG: iron ABC transporter permease [Eubacteriales bacterium]|nr:iron ABC transporter permease [Eubacteriales bacterium]